MTANSLSVTKPQNTNQPLTLINQQPQRWTKPACTR